LGKDLDAVLGGKILSLEREELSRSATGKSIEQEKHILVLKTLAEVRLAVISREGDPLDAYRRLFDASGVQWFHALTISEFFRKLPDSAISGFVVDLPVIIRASDTEKLLLKAIEGAFPNIRVNWNAEGGFRALFSDSNKSSEENLKAFIDKCLTVMPRPLRKNDRKERNFNIMMWEDGYSKESAQRAFTIDISPGGFYVCTFDPRSAGTVFWILFLELNVSPFKVVVRWALEWGKSMRIPGFGGKFLELSSEQQKHLKEAVL
jgi:hypothetical protein